MAIAFSYKAAKNKYGTGNSFQGLTVVQFEGPDGVQACAYSANMNLDADGEPQAYANPGKGLKPLDRLGNAGYEWPPRKKSDLDTAEKKYNDLVQKKKDLQAPVKPGTPAAPIDATALKKLNEEIEQALYAVNSAAGINMAKWAMKSRWDGVGQKPKNWGTKLWHWYGVAALTAEEGRNNSFTERLDGGKTVQRKPLLEKDDKYADVYGKLPVVQQDYEPGPKYYVSAMPGRRNTAFPVWDQRSTLPPGDKVMVPFGALSTVLAKETGLQLQDRVMAIRLDNGQSLSFPFLDSGHGTKVAEVGLRAFTGVGGVLNEANINLTDNRFMLLYLAFNRSAGQDVWGPLQSFAKAPNAEDFPVLLAFIASATTETRKNSSGMATVKTNPIQEFEKWKKSGSDKMPEHYDVIKKELQKLGFDPPIVRRQNSNPRLHPSGPFLQPPEGINPVSNNPPAPFPGKGPEGPFLRPPQAPWK
jgi:hypothetical protein